MAREFPRRRRGQPCLIFLCPPVNKIPDSHEPQSRDARPKEVKSAAPPRKRTDANIHRFNRPTVRVTTDQKLAQKSKKALLALATAA